MEIKRYIESGVLESYVLGATSEEETVELFQLKNQHPEIQNALFELETDLERIAQHMAIVPPPGMLTKIEDSINELINRANTTPQIENRKGNQKKSDTGNANQFIEVEAESKHIRVHKLWRWVFGAVFILSKIFLIASIYYFLENRQAQQQIQELKSELRQYSISH
jgi:hypothetical protein